MKFSRFKAPNTLLIIFSLIIVTAIMTWIIPGGEFEKMDDGHGHMRVVPGSFQYIDSHPQGLFSVLLAPIRGFVDAALIIGFVLIVGGAFGVLQKTEAITAGIRAVAKAHDNSAFVRMTAIPLFMILFSLGGSVFGMAEETIPFVLIFIPLALALGYDSIVGVAIPFVASGAGFAGAFLNPFTIGIAQDIAGLQLFSGIEYRVIVWIFTTALTITFVMVYAAKIRKNPEKSPTFEMDKDKKANLNLNLDSFTGLEAYQKLVLLSFALAMVVLVIGVVKYEWYIEEIAALFVATGIVTGIIGKLKGNEIVEAFLAGAKDLVATAVIIGLARGIQLIAQDGRIIDTILNSLANLINQLHPVVSSQAMFLVQTFINFFVPSGSGQAALTMPVMAPLADLVGVTRQTAVLAYQFGDGFSNLIIPTSAVLMGILSLAGIPWDKWARWMIPLQLLLLVLGFILLVPPYLMNWQ